MTYIYIAFVDTPGFFARLIRTFLRQRYVHVALSADRELSECYSVGRRNPAVPVFAGFEKEERYRILHTFPGAYYRVCRLSCTREQKRRIMERLRRDYERRYRIHYAVLALPFLVLGIPFYVRDQYTCSSYLARVLEEQGIRIAEKHFSLVTPKDFYAYEEMDPVFEGELSELVAADEAAYRANPLGHWLEGVSVYE